MPNLTEQLKRDGNLLSRPKRPTKKKKGIRRASPRRQEQLKLYWAKRRAFLAANPLCQAAPIIKKLLGLHQTPVLGSVEIHHKRKPKSKYLNDETTWLAVSRWAHRWIEDNKSIARDLGLLHNI